ncbi:hypothetical protein PVAND_002323 [Polypedilum vanderplanki]|uniref:Uncharacterized protein n=1 Tax=Polypedilum vanderplanki TaxID=319348 RepID=A0A9J6BQM2_POLVA|nr:hypothetical protein PVAND_002323 [Polypedilum vanderplanki]
MLMRKIYYITGALLLAIAHSFAETSNGVGSFAVIPNDSETNTAKPKTIFKPAVTRAELKVQRSLNPDNMQTLNVRTNNGGIATILVKKRDGKTSINNEPRQAVYDVSNQYSRGEIRNGLFGPVNVFQDPQLQKLHQQQQHFENGRNSWSVTTLQQVQTRNPYDSYRFAAPSDEKSINLINSFMKHVQQVENGRQARSSDILRNDRASVHTKIPEPVTINSESVYVKDNQSQNQKRGRSLMEIDSDGIPLINGVRMPDDENDKRQTWRNARVINGELVPYENGYVPPRTVEYGQLIYPAKSNSGSVQSRSKSIGPFTTSDNFSEETSESENISKSIGPFSVRDMVSSRSNAPIGGSQTSIGPFSVADNSRNSNAKLIDYIKKINDQEYRKDYFAGRTPKDFGNTQQIQRRMLINPGNTYFPPSSKYSYDKSKSGEITTPILQYAHPEFGLQSVGSSNSYEEAKHSKPKSDYYTHPNMYQSQSPQRQNNAPMYPIEPALNTREYYQSYQKSPAVMYPQYSSNNYNSYIRRRQPEQPFWMKISDQVRDTLHSSFASVTDITKPIMDPILEAGEKISQNLGFSHPVQNQHHAQEKVGVYVPNSSSNGGTSYIFPALGMLAGGAALGLGAVAMGRIFDVSSLLTMRSNEDTSLEEDQKRALESIRRFPTTTLYLVDNDDKNNEQGKSSYVKGPVSYATSPAAQQKSNFFEVIAIPSDTDSSSIDPITQTSATSELISHQRRKRNK